MHGARVQDQREKEGKHTFTLLGHRLYIAYPWNAQVLVFEFNHMLSDTPGHVCAALDFFGMPAGSIADPSVLPQENVAGRCCPADWKEEQCEGHYRCPDADCRGADFSSCADPGLKVIECATRDELNTVYAPWNEMLYDNLARSAQRGERPPSEPHFPHFTVPPCTETAQIPPIEPPASPLTSGISSAWPMEAEQCTSNGCYPRIFIIGAQKGATSSVYAALKMQGTACGAVWPEKSWSDPRLPSSDKEAHVFDMSDSS